MNFTIDKAKCFVRSFSPYRKRFLSLSEELFPVWIAISAYLSDHKIEGAIIGEKVLAYLTTTTPKAFGVDIDDHKRKGAGYLLSVYERVCSRLHAPPSFVAKSPRGIHVWYFLLYPLAYTVIYEQIKKALEGLPVELRPTPTTGLRIPPESAILDPETLTPIHVSFEQAVSEAPIYHPAELFSEGILPDALRSTLKERKRRIGYVSIANAEKSVFPILPGTTNEALKMLVPVYRSTQLTPEEAAGRITALLAPVYDGELRNWGRLLKRVRSFYRNTPEHYEKPRKPQQNLFAELCAERIAELFIQSTGRGLNLQTAKRKARIKSLIAGIYCWKEYVNLVANDPVESSLWNYVYPFFRKNTREGYTPLPYTYMQKYDLHYNRVLPFLEQIGFLERSPYKYVPRAGICNYYRINDERFLV